MAKAIKFSGSSVVDQFGRPFRAGDLVFAANYDYVSYVVEGVDQQQGVIFISRCGSVDGRILRCSRPRWFQIVKKACDNA